MTKEELLEKVDQELENCRKFIYDKAETLQQMDLDNPTMKAIDYIHDACHTLMLPQGGRGPIPSMSELRKKNGDI